MSLEEDEETVGLGSPLRDVEYFGVEGIGGYLKGLHCLFICFCILASIRVVPLLLVLLVELSYPKGSYVKFDPLPWGLDTKDITFVASRSDDILFGAPRAYEKSEGCALSYFKETPVDQWVRATDFTPSCCIGQSSALCLELPYGVQLPRFRENFTYHRKYDSQFILESGFTFSHNLELVPIVGPPPGLEVPYKIVFKICSLVQHGYLPGPALDVNFFWLVDPGRIHIADIEHALEKLHRLKDCCYEPVKWLKEQYRKYPVSRQLPKPHAVTIDSRLVYVRRVEITPCKVYFCGPEVNVSNRVLRNYPEDIDNF
ncbi:hypothetical protein F0562_034122 [Nyssa sinensis]|uniref:Uncharacterized protein n=1 Tax=Nyssa sinensis TaxID=561372 RepID=A0A5J5AI05_9ASTE|nr:hypothetical protein F0562_034122 [Nyssa sinensis]